MRDKVIYTLNIGNYAPEIRAITYPLLKQYAHKIGADFEEIVDRQFPEWPVTYEKLQIFERMQDERREWGIYIDADALVHPDMFDVTDHLPLDTVAHNGRDMAGNRWRYDRFFRRDGRHIGSCNWFAVASKWCIDLWHPLDDLTPEQALDNIFPTAFELSPQRAITDDKNQPILKDGQPQFVDKPIITREHLIDDYTLSRNIAKYGLKHTCIIDIQQKRGDPGRYLWHAYTIHIPEKVVEMHKVLKIWGLEIDKPKEAERVQEPELIAV